MLCQRRGAGLLRETRRIERYRVEPPHAARGCLFWSVIDFRAGLIVASFSVGMPDARREAEDLATRLNARCST